MKANKQQTAAATTEQTAAATTEQTAAATTEQTAAATTEQTAAATTEQTAAANNGKISVVFGAQTDKHHDQIPPNAAVVLRQTKTATYFLAVGGVKGNKPYDVLQPLFAFLLASAGSVQAFNAKYNVVATSATTKYETGIKAVDRPQIFLQNATAVYKSNSAGVLNRGVETSGGLKLSETPLKVAKNDPILKLTGTPRKAVAHQRIKATLEICEMFTTIVETANQINKELQTAK